MGLITIANEHLTVDISTLGAELQSVRDARGTQRLWQGDPAFWKGRAPVLFPVAGGFRDDRYSVRGEFHTLPKHGFAKFSEFAVERADGTHAVFCLTDANEGFPFPYAFRVAFALEGATIRVDYSVENPGAETLHCSLGAHEAYACPEGVEAYELIFDEPETAGRHPLFGNLIGPETAAPFIQGRVLPLRAEELAHDALVYTGLASRGVTLRRRSGGRAVRVRFDETFGCLMFWTKPGAPYLCIEPWGGPPDALDASQRLEDKPGALHVKPGETDTMTHWIDILE